MNLFQATSPYAEIILPHGSQGTATYTVAHNILAAGWRSAVTYYALPVIPSQPVQFVELPTVTTQDQSRQFLPKPRALGLGLGSAWMSDDFDEPLGGELGFGEE